MWVAVVVLTGCSGPRSDAGGGPPEAGDERAWLDAAAPATTSADGSPSQPEASPSDAPAAPGLDASRDAPLSSDAAADSSVGSKFKPLQHFSMDSFTAGGPAIVTGGYGGDQLNDWSKSGFGGVISTAQHRPNKNNSLALSIRQGSDGLGGGTGTNDGMFGFQLFPPSSLGQYYATSGQTFHTGFWMYIPSSFDNGTNLQESILKFVLNCFPSVVTGKSDVHMSPTGYALMNEFDPHDNVNNNYPSMRPGTNPNYPKGEWFWFERATYLSTDGDASIIRIWVNDTLLLEQNGRTIRWQTTDGAYHAQTGSTVGAPSMPAGATGLEFVYVFSYWNGNSPQSQTVYVDDITTAVDETAMTTDAFGNPMIGMAAF
ncbi:MAG TPA: hypothetical protein VKU41_16055 [Polyangiaceae bacterium]|nr:hypothetical protein [Polyangiaceae bacterium]